MATVIVEIPFRNHPHRSGITTLQLVHRGVGLRGHHTRLAIVRAILLAAAPDGAALEPAGVVGAATAQFEAVWPDSTRQRAASVDNWTDDGRSATIGGQKL